MKRLFIVGVGRSGTSLLQSMFAAHPNIAMLPETGFFRRYCVASRVTIHNGGDLLTAVSQDDRLQRISEPCWHRVSQWADTAAYRSSYATRVYRGLIDIAAPCQKGDQGDSLSVVGDKDPRLIEFLPLIHKIFPDAFIIHIVRDPRDVLLSKTKAEWSQKRDWRLNVLASRFQYDIGEKWGPQYFGDRYQTTQYEELIKDPESALRRLTDRCGIDYDPQMLQFSRAAERLGGGRTERWKRETLGPLLVANSGKWRNGLTQRQIAVTEGGSSSWFRDGSYTRSVSIGFYFTVMSSLVSGLSLLYRGVRGLLLQVARRRMAR